MSNGTEERWLTAEDLRAPIGLRTGQPAILHLRRPRVQQTGVGVVSGTIEGPYGPLAGWPFRLVRAGRALGPDDLGGATTANGYQDGAWLTDRAGQYRFEALSNADLLVDVTLPGEGPRHVLSGSIEGPWGPLRRWPFRLMREGRRVEAAELRNAITTNEFEGGAWLTDDEGRYRFEGIAAEEYQLEVVAAGEPREP